MKKIKLEAVIDALTDRLGDLYSEIELKDTITFWKGVAAFVAKPDCEWMSVYTPMHEKIRNFVSILARPIHAK